MKSKLKFPVFLPALIACSLVSCRFGNYSEPPKGESNFTSMEIYRTQPKQFETLVIFQDNTQSENTTTPLSAIPTTLLDNFTNPVFLGEPKATPGVKLFIGQSQTDCMLNPGTSSCIGTLVDPAGNIQVNTASEYTQFGSDPTCMMNLQMQQVGYLDKTHPGTLTYSDGTTGTINGDLLLLFRIYRNFRGDCTAILGRLGTCYTDGTGCSTDELYWANQLFDPFIRQSGPLKIEDAARIKTLAYIVHFD